MKIKRLATLLCLLAMTTVMMADEFIRICTNNVEMVLRVSGNGRVYQSYLGKKLMFENDLSHLRQGGEVYLTHGMEDYFEPAIEVTHNDGNPSLLLKFHSHETLVTDKGAAETVVTLKDD